MNSAPKDRSARPARRVRNAAKPEILVASMRLPAALLRRLSTFAQVHQELDMSVSEIAALLPSVEGIILYYWPPFLTAEAISRMPKLRFIQTMSAGVNQVPFDRIDERITLSSNAGAFSDEVAEYAWSLIMAAAKNLLRYDRVLREGAWTPKTPWELGKEVTVVRGKALGVIGYGGIGSAVARLGSAFGTRNYALARRRMKHKGVRFFYGGSGLLTMLPLCDMVVIAVSLSEKTKGMIGAEALSAMKRNAILVNIARAEVVDQQSIYDFLASNPGFTYATDVWWTKDGRENFKPDLPFLSLPNFIGTPHASGPSATAGGRPLELAVENTIRFARRLKPRNVVDQSEYRR